MTSPSRVRRMRWLVSLAVGGALVAALAPVAAQAAGDTTPPTTSFSAPTKNQALPAGTVTMAGTSTDDLSGITSAQVAIKDRVAAKWWDPTANAWGTALKWITTTLTSPGAQTTTWSYDWSGGVANGSYFVEARATDTSANVAKSPFPSVNFTETASSGDTGAVPTFVKTFGGPGHATMYPSGMEIAPDGSIVIADTGNSHIEKYASDGTTLLWNIGGDGAGTGQFNNPRDVGIDSAGNIYVADTENSRIVKLGPDGSWITTFSGPTGDKISSPIGISVSGDKVYVADAGKKVVRVFNTSGTQLLSFGSSGTCTLAPLRDVDADAAGNIYVANYTSNDILKFSSTGVCLAKWGTKGSANGQFMNPYGVRLGPDPWNAGSQLVYVADSNNSRIQVFTTDGTYVGSMGTFGDETQPGTFAGLRRVAVAPDGDIWGADLWGWRVERWNAGTTADTWTYAGSTPAVPTAPPLQDNAVFNEVRGITFDASNHVVAMDSVNQRFVRFDATTGAIVNACGQRGWNDGAFNWPKGIAFDPVSGNMWVADTKQSRLQIINPDTCANIATIGAVGSASNQFNWPYSIAIRASDGTAWVADTKNNRVVVYNVATRAVISTFGTLGSGTNQFNQPRGIAIDPANGHILVADHNNKRVVELSDTNGTNIQWVASYTGANAGGFSSPSGVAADTAGRIYVADTGASRVVVLNGDGSTVYSVFTSPSGFNQPENIAVNPANNHIFVADTADDRIQEYSGFSAPPPPDTTPPVTAIALPTKNQSLAVGPITISGTATDDSSGVSTTQVAIQNRVSKLWWNPTTSTWVTARQWITATLGTPGGLSTTWSYVWTGDVAGGSYYVQGRSTDVATNTEAAPYVFTQFTTH